MAQRGSGYARIDSDAYWTPKWVYDSLVTAEPYFWTHYDAAPRDALVRGYDFLSDPSPRRFIATNPPFNLSDQFVRHALHVTQPYGAVAMLLPATWDTAKKRVPLFLDFPFKIKLVLTTRIRWENLEQKQNGPSTNHAWYCWHWTWKGKPMLGWI